MKNPKIYTQHVRTYFALRRAVGWIGILFPFTLMLGNYFIFNGEFVLPSISRYYYSEMHDVFVGGLCAMASFMFFYSGYGRMDKWSGITAGLLTLGVAFFPTTAEGPLDLTGKVHYVCASLLFLVLAGMSLFHFPRKRRGEKKRITDKIQVICGLLMAACVIALVLYFLFFRVDGKRTCYAFVAETVALTAFGVSWLTEGMDLRKEVFEN